MLEIELSVRSLVEFVLRCGSIDQRFTGTDRAAQGGRLHRRLQKAAGENYRAEVTMKAERVVDDILYRLQGRADGILTEPDGLVVDEIKTTAVPAERLSEDFNPLHWAQARCYAAFLCAEQGLPGVTVQLTYVQIDTDEVLRYRRSYTARQLEDFLLDTLHRYTPWARLSAEWREKRNASLVGLRFPFDSYRAGQYRLAGAVYRTVADGGRLFVSAPTGIGKTMSTVFPALKAMGEGKGDRLFYLTARSTTLAAAEDALARLRGSDPQLRLKSVTLTAKDKLCPKPQRECTPEACERAEGYYDRINAALYTFLQAHDSFTREELLSYAQQERLCPFELALDLSLFCDCILCDYNYLFDPVVSLQRFFTEGGDFIFLVDEAHDLADRARDMYSAELRKSSFAAARKALQKPPRRLSGAFCRCAEAFAGLHRAVTEAGERRRTMPFPEQLLRPLRDFNAAAQDWLDGHREGEAHAVLLQLFFDVRFFLRIAEMADERYTTLVVLEGKDVRVRLLCLDASAFLEASLSLGRAAVLFSATLSPQAYFIRTLGGGEGAKRLSLPSPFPQQNLCLLTACYLSTRYADRAETLGEVCRLTAAAVRARQGNYMVFAPSYRYMQQLAECFGTLCPELELCVQQSGMDEDARRAFLDRFSAGSGPVVGFCVLGGVFAEGIDLAGERLIGAVVVGVGLPQVCAEQQALRDYYAGTLGSGFEYAYQYPGMNRVLQAAGRVIRTQTDRGMVLLIDSRYGERRYRELFPPHWSHARRVGSAEETAALLKAFWTLPAGAPDEKANGIPGFGETQPGR